MELKSLAVNKLFVIRYGFILSFLTLLETKKLWK